MGLPTDPLSHAGLTVAAALLVDYARQRIFVRPPSPKSQSEERTLPVESKPGQASPGPFRRWNFDYRLAIIGSLLPDLLDRPLGLWLLPEVFNPSGRLFGHTLLFSYLFIVFCLLLARVMRSSGPLVLSVASAGHLLLDRVWESPETLFWPLYGLQFGGAEFDRSPAWLHWAQTGLGPIVFDGAGALALLIFAVILLRRRTTLRWLKTGVG